MALNFTTDTKRLICLAALLGIYLLSGAVVFQVLENENDKLEIQQLNSVKKLFLEKHNMTPDDFDFLVEKVENAVKHRCGGDPDQWCTSRWTYYASVYFTWSVVTTVGKVSSKRLSFNSYMTEIILSMNRTFLRNKWCCFCLVTYGDESKLFWDMINI